MKKLIKTQKGSAKKQLTNVLKGKTEEEEEMESYVTEGQKYLKTLDDKVQELQNIAKGIEQNKSIAEIRKENDDIEHRDEIKAKALKKEQEDKAAAEKK